MLDECDEMLNMGFGGGCGEDPDGGAGGHPRRRRLLFSATLPSWVKDITRRFLQASHKLVDLVGTDKMKVGGASFCRHTTLIAVHCAASTAVSAQVLALSARIVAPWLMKLLAVRTAMGIPDFVLSSAALMADHLLGCIAIGWRVLTYRQTLTGGPQRLCRRPQACSTWRCPATGPRGRQ